MENNLNKKREIQTESDREERGNPIDERMKEERYRVERRNNRKEKNNF